MLNVLNNGNCGTQQKACQSVLATVKYVLGNMVYFTQTQL